MTGEKTNTCVRCGDDYEPYQVFLRHHFSETVGYSKTQDEWNLHEDGNDGLCKPCRMAVTDYGSYLSETEQKELEPKHNV